MLTTLPLALLAVSPTTRLMRGLFDDTFAGIHKLGWFDWAILIPYFTVLVILSVFVVQRNDIIRTYFNYMKRFSTHPAHRFHILPTVTIQLPRCCTIYIIEQL